MEMSKTFLSFKKRNWLFLVSLIFEWVSSVCLTFELIKCMDTPNLSTLLELPIFLEIVAMTKPILELE